MEEFYPMPLFVQLSVRDVSASTDWYRDALGFRPVFILPGKDGAPVMSHLRLEKYQDIMLVQASGEEPEGDCEGIIVYINIDGGIEEIAGRVKPSGAKMTGPYRTEWNSTELAVTDPDGYRLTFSQVVDKNLSFDEVMGQG